MGSYGGHVLPGTFFIIFGLWYILKYSYNYLRYRSRKSYFSEYHCCGRLPCCVLVTEGCVKIFFTSVGILVELFYPGAPMGRLHGNDGNFINPMNWQHTTMYFFFLLSGVMDIICYTGRKVIPIGVDRLFGGLALFIEGYLFYFHLHGRSMIDIRVHVLLLMAVWPSALVAFLEFFFITKRTTLHALEMLRSVMIVFQGLWFWQVAYILYPPHGKSWDPCPNGMDALMTPPSEGGDSHDEHDTVAAGECTEYLEHINVSFITLFWTWHLAAVILFTTIVYTVMYKYISWRGVLDTSFSNGYMPVMQDKKMNGRLLMEEDGL